MGYRNIPLEIRKEYGEPMSDVIKGYALMGYSMIATAQAMGISVWAFTRWVKRLEVRHLFNRADYNDACKPINGKNGWPKGKPRLKPNRYTDQELLAFVAKCPAKGRMNDLAGFPAGSTIERRFGSWSRAKMLADVA